METPTRLIAIAPQIIRFADASDATDIVTAATHNVREAMLKYHPQSMARARLSYVTRSPRPGADLLNRS